MTTRHAVGGVKKRHLGAAVDAARRYHACHDLPIKTQQRFYARMLKLAAKVAADNGMDPADALAQITREAQSRGRLTLQPGKDF